jgi:hypothetical protein
VRLAARGAALGLVAVNVPLLVACVLAVARHPTVIPAGDTAVTEASVMDASHLTQTLGPYSRFGWSHPGPAWFYLLAPVYRLLGGQSYALSVASLVLLAATASAVVVLMARRYGAPGGLVAALVVLAYVHAVGLDLLRNPWNPWAILLPLALLLLLAAAAAAGSTVSLLGTLVVGSFLLQTHVSTAVTVAGVVVAAAALAWWTRRLGPGWPAPRSTRASRLAMAAAVIALAVMWLPPLVQQARGHPGNLGQIASYIRHPHGSFGGHGFPPVTGADRQSLHDSVAATGLEMSVFPLGRPGALAGPTQDQSVLGNRARLAVLIAYGAGSVALAALALRRRERFALAAGVLTLVGMVTATVSVTQVIGPLADYLVAWITALPLAFWLGWAALALSAPPRAPRLRPVIAATAAAAVAVATGAETVAAARLGPLTATATAVGADPVAERLWAIVDQRLGSTPPEPVLVHIASLDTWPAAAAILGQLYREDRPAAVDREWLFLFGERFRPSGAERREVVLVDAAEEAALAPPGGVRLGGAGTLAVYLRPA